MLLIIRNLPSITRYTDVKNLIQTHCDLNNVILDNLVLDGVTKKVTVGVADDVDADLIKRRLNGFVLAGNKLKIEEMRPKKGSQHNQNNSSSSNRSSTRWGSSIPPLMESNTTPGINPLMPQNASMGQSSSMLGPNIPMMGQNVPMMGFNPPVLGFNNPMMNQNNLMMGQNTPLMGQNSSMLDLSSSMMGNNSMMGQNMSMNRQNQSRNDNSGPSTSNQNVPKMGPNSSSMNQFNPYMGQMNPMMGPNMPIMGKNQPAMVPPPLMGNTSFSAPFYMTPQSNLYGTHPSGQQMASQLSNFSGQKGNMQSQNSEFPDSRNRKNFSDKPVWESSADDSNYRNKRYSDHSERDRDREGDRHDRGSSGSRRSKWDTPREDYESEDSRYKSQFSSKRVVKPWAVDNPPYNRNPEYGQFDRSIDREQDRYSRRQEPVPAFSGPNVYQNRMSSGGGRDSGSNYRGQSPPGYRRGPPREDRRERFSPPAKRAKPNNEQPVQKYVQPQKKTKAPPKVQKMTMKKILERDLVWRSQAAAGLVLEMFKTIKTDNSVQQNVAHNKMKTAVRNRLLIILNNRIMVKINDQMALYRRKFRPDEDQQLYNRIVRHIKHENEREKKIEPSVQETANPVKPSNNEDVKQPAKPVAKPAPPAKPQPKQNQTGELPKYPQGNKALHNIQKKNFKEEFITAAPSSELDDATKKAVEEEMQRMKEVILAECTNATDEAQKLFCERMNSNTKILEETTRMITLNLAKRILKSGTVPLVRVIGTPKPPRKAPLVEFLKDKGVSSLKKSDRKALYIVTCDSYESFDNLCALKDVIIDDLKVSFKPMYLTAPPEKVKYKKGQKPVNRPIHLMQKKTELDYLVEVPMDEDSTGNDDTNVGHNMKNEIKEETVSPVKNKSMQAKQSDIKEHEAEGDGTEQDDYDFTKDVGADPVTKMSVSGIEDAGDNYAEEDDDFEVNEEDLEDY